MFFVFRLFVLSKVIFGVCNVIFWVEIFAPGANVEMLCPHAGGLYHHSPVPVKHGQVKHCKMFLSSYCLFVLSYFLSFPFSPQSLWNNANCFVFSLSFCLFVFSYFVFPSPVNHQWKVKHCKRNFVFSFLSWCLFVSSLFCLLFQVQVQPQWNTANSIRTDIWGFFIICQIKKKVLKCQSSGPLNCQKERKNHFSIITKLLCGLIGKKMEKKEHTLAVGMFCPSQ